jgi:hypothetical protein
MTNKKIIRESGLGVDRIACSGWITVTLLSTLNTHIPLKDIELIPWRLSREKSREGSRKRARGAAPVSA